MPSDVRVQRALAEISKGSANFDYFFDSLTSPSWIKSLAQENVFSDPPQVERSEEGWIRIPGWTASKYLVRMAGDAPEDVLDVALSIETDNERIHSDLTEAALAMPGPLAARWAEREIAWLGEQRFLHVLLYDQLAQFVAHLVATDEIDCAFALAVELLRIYPPPEDAEDEHRWLLHASARFSAWEYKRVLDIVCPALLRADPLRALDLLSNHLSRALEWTAREPANKEDFSYIWRPQIGDEDRADSEVEQALVSALRDASIQALNESLLAEADLVFALERHGWSVFRRIVQHTLSESKVLVSAGVLGGQLLDRSEFEAPLPSPEYRALLVKGFTRLPPSQQEEILTWIDEGPDLDRYRDFRRRSDKSAPSEQELRDYGLRWRVLRLDVLADLLPTEWRARHEEFTGEVGEQRFASDSGIRTWVGPTSPYSVEDLATMSDEEIVAELGGWKPSDDWDAPTPEGLGHMLSELAQREPLRMSRLARELRGHIPPYIQWTLSGLSQALRGDKSVDWVPLLDLATWIVAQPRALPGGRDDEYGEIDPGWVWTRKELASMLSAGFESRTSPIPIAERERVWSLLAVLLDDPDPTPSHEERYGGANMDPSTLSLNTTRGQAMHAAVRYGLWVRRGMEADEPETVLREQGFARIPELQEVLDQHLDPGVDPSIAVRSVYGQWFPWLVLLDPTWSAARTNAIFEHGDPDRWAAAWGAYITFNRPYDDVFATLSEQYHLAVAALDSPDARFRWLGSSDSPEERLAHHLLSLYWRGHLEFSSDGLLGDFYRRADDALRGSATAFIGRSLRETDSPSDDVLTRMRSLWEMRLGASASEPEEAVQELGAFGWWFDARALDGAWRLSQAEAVLQLGIRLEANFVVFGALPTLALEFPAQSARVLRLMLEREKNDWGIDAHRDEIKETLAALVASEDPEVRQAAVATAHWLGAQGYRDFRPLVAPAVTTNDESDVGPPNHGR